MDETPSNPSIVKRPIRRPFFLVHTPDRLGDYLQKDTQRIVASKREKLSSFLAPAQLTESGTDNRGKPIYEITYDLSAHQEDITQMEYLPQAVVTALEEAAKAFCSAGDRVTDYELKLRQGFRLPDPDLDPQAYHVYGPIENRQLIILWGAEVKADSSLPLVKIPGYTGPTIIDKLKARIMGASAMRQEALKLLDRSNLPLARFIATPVHSGDGKIREVICNGKRIPATSLKRMKHLPKAEIEAFAQAARLYYEGAYPDAQGISAYEKELRTAMRVPSLALKPNAYFRSGKRLVILASPEDNYDECVSLTTDSILGIPAPRTDEEGRSIPRPTTSEQLESRATPVKLYLTMAAAGFVVVAGAAAIGIALLDTTPPAIARNSREDSLLLGREDAIITTKPTGPATHADTPENIRIVWDGRIDKGSIRQSTEPDAENTFTLSDEDGRPVPIAKVTLTSDDTITDLTLGTQMKDGKTYKVEIHGLADTSLRHNAITQLAKTFQYRDTVPPTALETNAEGADSRKLSVRFDEALEKESAENRYNYKIDGFNIVDAVYNPDTTSVTLTCERQNATGIDKGFVNKGRYTLSIQRDIKDASVNRNSRKDPYDLNFVYEDSIPPVIGKVTAPSQMDVDVVFAEPLKAETVAATAFTISIVKTKPDDGDEVPQVVTATLGADKYTVRLTTSPLHNGIKYQVSAVGIQDLQGNAITAEKPSTATFFFDGREDTTPPAIMSLRAQDDTHVEITFGKPVRTTSVRPAAFEVISDMRDNPIPVTDAQVSGSNPSKVVLTLNVQPVEGERIYIIAKKITDRLGNVAELLKSTQFTLKNNPRAFSDLGARGSKIVSRDTIELVFTEKLDATAAGLPRHYYYSGNATVDSVAFDPASPERVRIHLSAPDAQPGAAVIASGLVLEGDDSIQAPVTFKAMP
jgi:hypothetical protein